MALGAFAMVVVLTVLTIIARNGYGRANPLRRFRRLLPPRGSTSGVAAPGQGDANAAKPRLRRGCLAGALEGTAIAKAAALKGQRQNPGLREDFRERRLLPVWLDHDQVREVFLE